MTETTHPLPIVLPLTFLELGMLVATPGAMDVLQAHGRDYAAIVDRFRRGDWGVMDQADRDMNSLALVHGDRLMGVYPLGEPADDTTVWIICYPYDHTTLLVPEEY